MWTVHKVSCRDAFGRRLSKLKARFTVRKER